MGGLFGGTSTPTMPAVPVAPNPANKQAELDEAARLQQMRLQRGTADTLLTTGAGVSNAGSTSKVLLGQ